MVPGPVASASPGNLLEISLWSPIWRQDNAFLCTLSPTTGPAQRLFPCSSKSEQARSGENLDPVATFIKCDLAQEGSHHLSAAKMDLAPWVVPTGQLSLKPAATGLSQEGTCVRRGATRANYGRVRQGRVWGLDTSNLTKGTFTIPCGCSFTNVQTRGKFKTLCSTWESGSAQLTWR